MENQIKSFICEDCEQKLVEVGISQLYEVAWQYQPKTHQFDCTYADISDRKEGDFICNHCGEHIDPSIMELIPVQSVEFVNASEQPTMEAIQEDLTCESCETSYLETGVSQLWDVDWKWSESEQRFIFDQAYASELDDYAICCNGCGHEIEEDLPLAEVQVKGV